MASKRKTPGVSVLTPWRETPDRAPLWAHLRGRWEKLGYQVVEGSCPDGPWCKAAAVEDALSRAEHDIIIMADADVWTDGVTDAVQMVVSGAARWAVPHFRLLRLTARATAQVLESGEWPAVRTSDTYQQRPYPGFVGGGMVVLTRGLYREAPLDPRFVGWGQEDEAWACALRVIGGREWRGLADMYHLYHPAPPRMSRGVGSMVSYRLLQRYQRTRDGVRMRALIAEHQAVSV